MARNMCYDHEFSEIRDTLMVERGIETTDLHTALIGSLSNSAVDRQRLERLFTRIIELEKKIEQLEKKEKITINDDNTVIIEDQHISQ